MKIRDYLVFLASLIGINTSSATFTITPNNIPNDYTGVITLQINGVSAGESVEVVQFYDFNGNGAVDGSDIAIRGDTLADGKLILLGGATNINEMHDEDGAVDGSIRSSLRFVSAPELTRGVGSYIFRLTSPSNHFPSMTVPLTVTSALYDQKVQGLVQSGGTNVPYAAVALIQPGSGRTGTKVIVGGATDANGSFTLSAPAGTYDLVAFRPGYVMSLLTAPHLTLAASGAAITNLNLIAATTMLAGSLVDDADRLLPVVPYSAITLFSSDLLFTVSVADSKGTFSVPVTPSVWTIRPEWQSALTKSYLPPQQGSYLEPNFNTSAGPVSGAIVPLKRATALIYGKVQDNHSNNISGIVLSASADGGAFSSFGVSGSDGFYAMATDAGGGYVNVEGLTDPPANRYLWSGDYFNITADQGLNLNVTGKVVTAHFLGQMLDNLSAPVSNFGFFANSTGGSSLTATDANGFFDLPVAGGGWELYPDADEAFIGNYIFPGYSFQIVDGVNLTNNIIVQKSTGVIAGSIHDANGLPSSPLYLTFSGTIGLTNFKLNAYSDANGDYSVRVFNGNWTVSLSPYDLLGIGNNPANPINLIVPPTNGVANFILIPIGAPSDSPQITTKSLPDAFVGQFYNQTLMATNAVRSFDWTITTGALPSGLVLDEFLGNISGTPTTTGVFNFTAQLSDGRGTNAFRSLAVKVLSAPEKGPVLDAATLLPGNIFSVRVTGLAGQSYTLQSTTTLKTWTDILTTNAPSNVFFLQEVNATGSDRMFRLRVGL